MSSNLLSPPEEKTEYSVEEQLQLLLQEAGLESVPIDPSSLEALKAFVAKDDYNVNVSISNELSDGVTSNNNNVNNSHPPISNVEPHPELKRFTSELTVPSADSFCSKGEESSVAVAGSFAHLEGASPVENQILEQLHRQTRLLLDMQRRIDELTSTVEYLSTTGGGVGVAGPRTNNNGNTTTTGAATSRYYSRVSTPSIVKPENKTPAVSSGIPPLSAAQQPAATVPRPAAPVPPRGAAPNNNNQNDNNNNQQGGVVDFIKRSFLFKVGLVFLTLRRRYGVQELDGGLIFKVLFMMAILTARMSSSSKRFGGDTDWHTKFAVLTVIVVVGFLAQTGYLKYFYIFFFKENYPGRIWRGEDANEMIQNPEPMVAGGPNNNNGNNDNNNNNNEAPALPRGQFPPNPQQPGQAGNFNNGAAANNGWRNTFLGGMIPQADQGGVAGALQDVALLFGSFLMSIFPMWQLEEQVPRQPPQPRPPQPPVEGAGGVAAGPGEVRPPRDPVQAVDDSDDDDDDFTEED